MAADVSDLGDTIGSALGRVAREATHSVSRNGNGSDGMLSGRRGVVAAAVAAAAAPLAAKGAEMAVKNVIAKRAGGAGESSKDDDGAGPVRKVADRVKGAVTKSGGGGKDKKGTPGVGKGRRMPVQQSVDIGVPLSVAYNEWTQFEEWPQFMHRLVQVTQEDDCTVSFKAKVWAVSKEFVAEIVEQRPDERIQWKVSEGLIHTGVVTFHELAPRLTRVQLTLDVEPGSLVEKAARGMRHVKRAVRADLARFKAFIEMQEAETGAWRGTIHEGKVVEQRDASSGSESSSSARPRSRAGSGSRASSGRSGQSRARAGSSRQRSSRS